MKSKLIINILSNYFVIINSSNKTTTSKKSSSRVNIRTYYEIYANCSSVSKSRNSGNTQERNPSLGFIS